MYLVKNKSKALLEQRGITLIALVVTIVVILILAGVSISMLSGDDGIIINAGKAKEETDQSALEEEVKLAVSSNNIEKQTGGVGNLEEKLNKIQGATVTKPAEDTYYVEREGHEVTVYEDGTMEGEKIDIWDGTSKEKPEVDELGNWHIYTTNQMKFFADYCNDKLTEEEKETMPEITDSTTVYLENNLDMGARQKDGEITSGTAWTPVNMKKGIFEGKEHSISGIYEKSEDMICGLFSDANTIQNLSIKNSYIESTGKSALIGGISAFANSITNCHNVNTTVKATSYAFGNVGGVIGFGGKDTTKIIKCTNSGEIIGINYVGGIEGGMGSVTEAIVDCTNTGKVTGIGKKVGGITGDLGKNKSITNCYNAGEITGTGERVGGIVGEATLSSTIDNCHNTGKVTGENNNVGGIAGLLFGNITNSYNTGIITGAGQVGGITGQIGMDCVANIKNCYNTGEISGNTSIGGIIGWTSVTGTSGRIENNYNKGLVKGTGKVGGIILRSEYTFVVTNCYNKGNVEGSTNIGAIIGEQLNGNNNLSNLYYLNTLPVKAINNQDYETPQNIKGISENFNSYEEFINWLEE